MTYDFETIIDRTDKDAIAVDCIPVPGAQIKDGFSKIPMWVADMNFAAAPSVTQAIAGRLAHPAFGYFSPRKEYYRAIINWHKTRYGNDMPKASDIGYENGVLGCLASALNAFTAPGDAVLLHAPTYIGFTGVINNNGRKIILSELIKDENGIRRMDYEDMDKKIKKYNIHFCIFCSPHNPAGRVWEKEEIERAMEVYEKNECMVFSDEIWADITLGNGHIPTQTVSEYAKQHTIAAYAPSKTFNLAGLVGSYHIIYSKYLKDRLDRLEENTHYNSMNIFSMYALMGAYCDEGARWVDELNCVLKKNVDYAYDYITKHFKGISLFKPQGTYMLYLDCSRWCKEHNMTLDELLKAGISVGVIWQDGRPFNGPDTVRINLASPFSMIEEAFGRLDKYVFNPESQICL